MGNHIKETVGVSAGLTAPVWLEAFNAYVGAAIGLCTLIYVIGWAGMSCCSSKRVRKSPLKLKQNGRRRGTKSAG